MKGMFKTASFKTVLGIFLSVMVLAGCSNNEGSTSNNSDDSGTNGSSGDKRVHITLKEGMGDNQDEETVNAWKGLAKQYNEKQDKVELEIGTAPGTLDKRKTWLTTVLQGKNPPTLFSNRVAWSFDQSKKDRVKDLAPYLDQPNPYNDDKTWKDTFDSNIFDQLKDPSDENKIPSFTAKTVSVRILYNKDIFDKYDLKPPESFAEFMDLQKKLKDNGVTPYAAANHGEGDFTWSWSERLLASSLMDFEGDDGLFAKYDFNENGRLDQNEMAAAIDQGDIDMTKPQFTDAYKLLKEWSQYWAEGYNSTKKNDAYDMFLRGEAAMTFTLSSNLQYFQESEVNDFDYASFPFPKVTSDSSKYANGTLFEMGAGPDDTYSIPSSVDDEKADAAVDFMMYASSPEGARYLEEKLNRISTVKDVDQPDNLEGFQLEGEQNPMNLISSENFQNAATYSQKNGQLFLQGEMSIDEFSQELQKTLKSEADKLIQENDWNKDNNYGAKK